MKVINRIKKSTDFGLAINNGTTIKTPSFIIHYLKDIMMYHLLQL